MVIFKFEIVLWSDWENEGVMEFNVIFVCVFVVWK